MIITILISTLLTVVMFFVRSFTSMFIVVLLCSMSKAPITSLVDSLVIETLEDKAGYGALRLWGAISFGLMSFLGGLLASSGTEGNDVGSFRFLFFVYAVFSLLASLVILLVIYHSVFYPPTKKDTPPSYEVLEQSDLRSDLDSEAAGGPKDQRAISIAAVFASNPSACVFAVVVFLSGVGSGVIDAFLFVRLKQLGGSSIVMGVSRAITCAAEVPCFQLAGRMQKKYGTWPVMVSTQIAFVIRFSYYSALRQPWAVLPCEVLHGFTFAVMWNTACTYANEIAPKDAHATMQSLLEGLHWGLGSGLGALLGGLAYDTYGAVILFEASALMSLCSLILALLACKFCRTQLQNSIALDETRVVIETDCGATRFVDSDVTIEMKSLPIAINLPERLDHPP
jgi:hypothetical protein